MLGNTEHECMYSKPNDDNCAVDCAILVMGVQLMTLCYAVEKIKKVTSSKTVNNGTLFYSCESI